MFMGEKTIRISEETFQQLAVRRRGEEEIEAVIDRLLTEEEPLAGFGAWSETTIDESVQAVKAEMDAET
jgi:predicted CopG family antitoxin